MYIKSCYYHRQKTTKLLQSILKFYRKLMLIICKSDILTLIYYFDINVTFLLVTSFFILLIKKREGERESKYSIYSSFFLFTDSRVLHTKQIRVCKRTRLLIIL